jgi:osmotically-inducible protein OsmY
MNKLIYLALVGVMVSQLHGCAAVVVGGAAVGTSAAMDRRTTGVYVSDQEIELQAMDRLGKAYPQKTNSISATSYNQQVLLTGQVRDEAARSGAAQLVKAIPDVRTVFNELGIGEVSSFSTDANDTAITSNVKTRLLSNDRVPGTQIKVVTESGVVYLMGLLTQAEAKAAAEVASSSTGVAKVVTLFEIIN